MATSLIDSAVAGLQYAQAGLLATSQNVAGSSVEGYVRRRPDVQISALAPTSSVAVGTSFAVEGFSRYYSSFLESQIHEQKARVAFSQTLIQSVSTLDAMLINPANSIAEGLGRFFNAAGSLANEPGNIAYQQSFLGAADQATFRIRGTADEIARIGRNAQQGLADVLNEANNLASYLAQINAKIRGAFVPGFSSPSADLLDERDRILVGLQDLVGGQVTINDDGTASHQLRGVFLVEGERANFFTNDTGSSPVLNNITPDTLRLRVASMPNQAPSLVSVSNVFDGGQAGAYVELLSNFVPESQRQLNLLAGMLVYEINRANPSGEPVFQFRSTTTPASSSTTEPFEFEDLLVKIYGGLNKVPSKLDFADILERTDPKSSGYYMLELVREENAATVPSGTKPLPDRQKVLDDTLYSTLIDPIFDARLIVANRTNDQVLLGSITANSAAAIESLRATFAAPITQIVSGAATKISGWNASKMADEAILSNLQTQKESISGVNLDEEAANLVRYQQLYAASSRLIQSSREMFDTLLAMISGR
jgi:flagellar hook-associated protein 1